MDLVRNQVEGSTDIREAAMNLNAKFSEVRRTIAGVWGLTPATENAAPKPDDTIFHGLKNDSGESVVGDDDRQLVDEQHFNPGGKYRSIVKLFIHYEFQRKGGYAVGTGWLITPDLLVTAGHCSYDWSNKYGRATEVKAYVGYRGRDKLSDRNVEFRTVEKIVVPENWLKIRGQKANDVSFMKLNKPFTNITPFKFEETPEKGDFMLGVVGYPGDLKDPATGEKGALMYEMFIPTRFELATQPDTMIEYSMDTFGGSSGSPVLKSETMSSIGVHVYGGNLNSASAIGKFGNPYSDYIRAFDMPWPNQGLSLIEIPRNGASTSPAVSGRMPMRDIGQLTKNTRSRSPIKTTSQRMDGRRLQEINEEGFFDIFTKAVKFVAPFTSNATSTVAPTALGQAGASIAALAGFTLNAAGRLAESAEESGGLEHQTVPHGPLERAILAEAVFKAISDERGLSPETEEGIFLDIEDTVMRAAPTIKKVAPHVIGAMMEPALRIVLDSLHKYGANTSTGGTESAEDVEATEIDKEIPPLMYPEAIDHPADASTEGFLQGILSASRIKTEAFMGDDEETIFGNYFRAATRLAGKGLTTAAQHGLPILSRAISDGVGGGDVGSTGASPLHDALCYRALVAEATLQAVMKLPPAKLEEEGMFGNIFAQVKKIAPTAMEMAPSVIGAVSPIVGRMVGASSEWGPRPVPHEGSGIRGLRQPPR